MEWGGGARQAQVLRCPLTKGADGTLGAIQMGKEHRCDLVETGDGTYRCTMSGEIHKCGADCKTQVEGTEGMVCFLTGRCLGAQSVLHRPFNREGRSQSHYVMRAKSFKKRRHTGGLDLNANKSRVLVHKALSQLLLSTKRTQLHAFYHDRFIAEAIKAARKQNGVLLGISRCIKSVAETHIMQLLPQAEHQQLVDNLSEPLCTYPAQLCLTPN